MSAVLQRVQSIFKRKKPPKKLPSGTFPNPSADRQPSGTITKPPDPTDEDDDEEVESSQNYNVPEQTQLRGPERNTMQSQNPVRSGAPSREGPALPPNPLNPSNVPSRGAPSTSAPNIRNNPNPNPSISRNPSTPNAGTAPNTQARSSGLPALSQIQDLSSRQERNPNSTSTNNPQPSIGGFPPGMNLNQSSPPPPPANNPQPSFSGFPPGMNLNQSSPPPPPTNNPPNRNSNQTILSRPSTQNPPMNNSNNSTNPQQRPSIKQPSSFQNRLNDDNDDNVSRIELDYPIENVLIDANIPSSIAIKINDVVERDRFGKAYHIHRYTFEPSSRHTSFNNNDPSDRRSAENPLHNGTRHIREIHNHDHNPLHNDTIYPHRSDGHHRHRNYSEMTFDQYVDQLLRTPGSTIIHADHFNDLQQILSQYLPNNQMISTEALMSPFQSNSNIFPEPVVYLTARALPNDPMRNY